jgi:hypothetical protein
LDNQILPDTWGTSGTVQQVQREIFQKQLSRGLEIGKTGKF